MEDSYGRKYATVAHTRVGSILETDDGFTCMKLGETKEVYRDEEGLYIECSEGQHYLNGQVEKNFYMGLYPKE